MKNIVHTPGTYEITKTLSSPLSPLVTRVSESRYVTSKSPVPVLLVCGLNASGIRGSSSGGNCEKFPVVFTVVFSNIILIFEDPESSQTTHNQEAVSRYNTTILISVE
jgi:hypothetical protein